VYDSPTLTDPKYKNMLGKSMSAGESRDLSSIFKSVNAPGIRTTENYTGAHRIMLEKVKALIEGKIQDVNTMLLEADEEINRYIDTQGK
jgi:hypothetical protein